MSRPDDRRPDQQPDDVPAALQSAWDALPKQEPPDLVDQAVLNRARAAVEAPHSSRPWSFGWPHALTTAAVIVLAVTLIIPLRETGQPGTMSDAARPVTPVENRSQDDLELREEALQDVPAAAAETGTRERREAAPRSLASPALEKAAPAAMEAAASADAAMAPGTESRLQAIRALVEAGELAAAREALAAFRQDYPDLELPPDLAALLDAPVDESRP